MTSIATLLGGHSDMSRGAVHFPIRSYFQAGKVVSDWNVRRSRWSGWIGLFPGETYPFLWQTFWSRLIICTSSPTLSVVDSCHFSSPFCVITLERSWFDSMYQDDIVCSFWPWQSYCHEILSAQNKAKNGTKLSAGLPFWRCWRCWQSWDWGTYRFHCYYRYSPLMIDVQLLRSIPRLTHHYFFASHFCFINFVERSTRSNAGCRQMWSPARRLCRRWRVVAVRTERHLFLNLSVIPFYGGTTPPSLLCKFC